MKKTNWAQLIEQAEQNIQKVEEDKKKKIEEAEKQAIKELVILFQERLAEILELVDKKEGKVPARYVKGFEEYGFPSKGVSYKLDDEKFEVVFDFSSFWNPRIVHNDPGFNYQKFTWEILVAVLEKYNIQLTRKYEFKVEEGIKGISSMCYNLTDIITATILKESIKDKKIVVPEPQPVISEETEKAKTKRKSIFSNLLNKKVK